MKRWLLFLPVLTCLMLFTLSTSPVQATTIAKIDTTIKLNPYTNVYYFAPTYKYTNTKLAKVTVHNSTAKAVTVVFNDNVSLPVGPKIVIPPGKAVSSTQQVHLIGYNNEVGIYLSIPVPDWFTPTDPHAYISYSP